MIAIGMLRLGRSRISRVSLAGQGRTGVLKPDVDQARMKGI